MNRKAERLMNGEVFVTSEGGNSMVPLIHSRQPHKLKPCKWDQCDLHDIVYCKVRGRFVTHLVKAINPKRGLLIANNRGHENGWTKHVFGKVIEVLPMNFKASVPPVSHTQASNRSAGQGE